MNRNLKIGLILFLFFFTLNANFLHSQDFMMQGWYWDYPGTVDGKNWADTLQDKATALGNAGFTYIWLPPLSRASSGSQSNGYDPQDLYDLGEAYGGGATRFGTRSGLNSVISAFNSAGIYAVVDMVYNHRDGGKAEDNSAVEGWIENLTWAKADAGDNPYPSDRFRCYLPIGGATGYGAGNYYFKIRSASWHTRFDFMQYKFYVETNTVGWQGQADVNETEPNGGGDCGQGNNSISLGVNMVAETDDVSGCIIDEFHLNLSASDFNSAGDTIWVYMSNQGGNYSDHYIYGLWYDGTGADIQSSIKYQTYTDFTNMPSGMGSMNWQNFKPNGNATDLAGDWDWPWFFYDYDQKNVAATMAGLFDWTRWFWNDVGIRGYRLDAVKHFNYTFVGDLLDNLHDNGIDPGMVVGEFYDGNSAALKGWVDNVLANMDTDTKATITPRVFDFSLRYALEAASDQFGYDVRNVFNASIVDAQGMSGFNAVTFVDNHDFRDAGQPVDNDPILAYAYILTNNQVGLPCVYYYDYYNRNLKNKINDLITVHQKYIFGASQRDYLSRFSTPYYQNFSSGYASTTLIYQLSGAVSGRDVIVAINYAGETLKIDQQINTTTMGLAVNDMLTDILANSAESYTTVDANSRIHIELPPRSYSVWVEGDLRDQVIPVELTAFTATVNDGAVILNWTTQTETENYGFHVYRSQFEDRDYVKITQSIIPGAGSSEVVHHYSYTDATAEASKTYYYKLASIDYNGNVEYHGPISTRTTDVRSIKHSKIPNDYALEQNYPNPFNPETVINFAIREAGKVSLKIYDLQGQLVRTLADEEKPAGFYSVTWNGTNDQGVRVSSGTYLYTLKVGEFEETKKLTFLK